MKVEVSALRTGGQEKTSEEEKGDARSRCAVWGGLPGTFEEASQWVKDQLVKLDVALSLEIFVKGGDISFKKNCSPNALLRANETKWFIRCVSS